MKTLYTKFLVVILLSLPLFYGCEKEEILMSKEKIGKQLTHTWKKLFTPSETTVTWQFEDGKIYIRYNNILRAQGNYTIDCSVTKVKVILSGLPTGFDYLNLTWQVISLDDETLVITDLAKGIQENEFVVKN